jgi:ribosomal protein L37AE/L43A
MKKSIKVKTKKNKDGTIDVTMTCKKCGEPIDRATDMGIFCKNMCGSEDSKKAYEKIKTMFPFLK